MKLSCFLVAEYAAMSVDNRLTIAGTFDSLNVRLAPGAPADAAALIPFPQAYIVAVIEASISDGLSHQMGFRILNGNGEQLADEMPIRVTFALNPFGRPMRHHMILSLHGLKLPGPDDYVFELRLEGQAQPFGEFSFSVGLLPPPENG